MIETPSVLDTVTTGKQATEDGEPLKETQQDHQITTLIQTKEERKIAETTLQVIREETRKLSSSKALAKPEIQQEIVRKVQRRMQPIQAEIPGLDVVLDNDKTVTDVVKTVSETIVTLTIDIPQIVVLPTREVNYGFTDFDLQHLEQINYQPVSQEILLRHLEGEQMRDSIHFGDDDKQAQETRLEDYIVRNLMDLNEIDYDAHADLLYNLAGQLVNYLEGKWQDNEKVKNILVYYQQQLRNFVWVQMKDHLWSTPTDYQANLIQGFDVLEPNIYTIAAEEKPRDFRAPVQNKQDIRKMLFTGFKRCCYPYQKFDSFDGELMLARILEDDDSVLKWMKPAPGKFKIEYQSGDWYEPDFVVETTDCCLLIEPKRANEIDNSSVLAKKRAAEHWCYYANEHAERIGGKNWMYLLIPHNDILPNSSLDGLIKRFS